MSELSSPVSPGIVGLFLSSSPAAILGRIGAVVVDAIDALAFWPPAHIRKEIFKRVSPTIANGNTPATVLVITMGFFVVAAAFHGKPTTVFGSRPLMGLAVCSLNTATDFFVIATARSGFTASKPLSINPFDGAAIAAATPIGLFIPSAHIRTNYSPAIKLFPRQIDQSF
jgi:hypothetical protein